MLSITETNEFKTENLKQQIEIVIPMMFLTQFKFEF